jgi:hypothetical protein
VQERISAARVNGMRRCSPLFFLLRQHSEGKHERAAAMKIAFFGSNLVSPYWNDGDAYCHRLLKALAGLGHDITFCEPDSIGRQLRSDVCGPPRARVVSDVWGGHRGVSENQREICLSRPTAKRLQNLSHTSRRTMPARSQLPPGPAFLFPTLTNVVPTSSTRLWRE